MEKFFDALYTRLILRDVLGKITPGSLLLVAAYMSLLSPAPDIHAAIDAARATTPSGWLLIFPIGWLAALAIQAFGGSLPKRRFVPYIRYSDEPIENMVEYHRQLVHFWKRASEPQQQLFERFVVIHEATGNASLALVLAVVILAFRFHDAMALFLFAGMLLGAIWLGKMHRDALKLKMAIFMEVLCQPLGEAGPDVPKSITGIN
jgi:hypothetical protein